MTSDNGRYRLVGVRKPARKPSSATISTEFRCGNGKSALAVTNSNRTLGSSAYRLSPSAEERARHGARPTNNTAAFVPSGERVPMRNVQPGKNGKREMTERTAVQ